MTKPLDHVSGIEKFRTRLASLWPSIQQAEADSQRVKKQLSDVLQLGEKRLVTSDSNFVVFGSLARCEWTHGSDLDWTYLIDGASDPEHLTSAQKIANLLEQDKYCKPGPTGVFGSMAFSHDIIHQIGGINDTNRNMTQRILLLLESDSILNRVAYNRVIAGILYRYLQEDTSFITDFGKSSKIPRFLLNDIVRFWRTMAVDFASKQRERAGDGWALRNLKLRMSRKLIFVSGLLTCFSCRDDASAALMEITFEEAQVTEALVNHLKRYIHSTPLEIVAHSLIVYGASDDTARKLFDAYDVFLSTLNNPEARQHLEQLKSGDAFSSAVFQDMREISHQFQDALSEFFFQTNPKLSELVKQYGVF